MPDLEYLSIVTTPLPPSALREGDLVHHRSRYLRVAIVQPDPDSPDHWLVQIDPDYASELWIAHRGDTFAVALPPDDPSLPDRLADHARSLGWEVMDPGAHDPYHAHCWFRRGRVAVWQTCPGGGWMSGVQAGPGDGYARHVRYGSLLQALEDNRDVSQA